MAVIDAYRAIVWANRNIPGLYGLRPHTVSIVISTTSGVVTGEGAKTASVTPLVEAAGIPPKVRWLKDEELALGSLQAGTVRIGPITPDFPGGGTAIGVLSAASLSNGQQFHILITGPQHPNGAKYALLSVDAQAALHYYITATPVSDYVAAPAPPPEGDLLLDGGDILTDPDGNPLTFTPDQLVDGAGDSLTDGADDLTIV